MAVRLSSGGTGMLSTASSHDYDYRQFSPAWHAAVSCIQCDLYAAHAVGAVSWSIAPISSTASFVDGLTIDPATGTVGNREFRRDLRFRSQRNRFVFAPTNRAQDFSRQRRQSAPVPLPAILHRPAVPRNLCLAVSSSRRRPAARLLSNWWVTPIRHSSGQPDRTVHRQRHPPR